MLSVFREERGDDESKKEVKMIYDDDDRLCPNCLLDRYYLKILGKSGGGVEVGAVVKI